jgi:hypothetical protein
MNQLVTKGEGVPDLVLLDTISEDAVVENLRVRYDKKIIYVRVFQCAKVGRDCVGLQLVILHMALTARRHTLEMSSFP